MKPEKLKTAEVAAQFGVSQRTIRRWGRGGRSGFPSPLNEDGKLVWSQNDLLRFEGVEFVAHADRLREKYARLAAKFDALGIHMGH